MLPKTKLRKIEVLYRHFIFTAATMALTRTKITKIYPDFGIDTALEEFLGSQAPSNQDVRHFFYWKSFRANHI